MNKLYEEFHTEECKQAYNKFLHECQLWMDQWGKTYHEACGARGGFSQINYPHSPDDYDLCSCTDPDDEKHPVCPRCGFIWEMEQSDEKYASNIIVQDELPCPMCGWNWGKNPDDVKPEWYGCECYILEPDCFGSMFVMMDETPELLTSPVPKKATNPDTDIDYLDNHPFGNQEKYIPDNDYFVRSDFAYDENRERED